MDLNHPLNCLTFNVQRGARRLGRHLETALKPHGLTAAQFSSLALLGNLGEQTITQLATLLDTDRTTLTRNLAVLVKDGLIKLSPSKDQRIRAYTLTDAGRKRLNEALPAWSATQAGLVTQLAVSDAETLLQTLNRLG
ncbi:MAG: MarR family transcriptional regulator [Deltaproteobacteria bacterium]